MTALDCTWFIEPSGSSDWTGGFESLDARGGGIELYDADGGLIWDCTGCSMGPSKLHGLSGGRIRYWSDGMESDARFVFFYHGHYGTATYGVGNKAERVYGGYDTNLTLPLVATDSVSSPPMQNYRLTVPANGGRGEKSPGRFLSRLMMGDSTRGSSERPAADVTC